MKNTSLRALRLQLALVIFTSLVATGCGSKAGSGIADDSETSGIRMVNRTPEVKVSSVEEDIAAMRDAGIGNIFVIRKSDRSVFNAEDKDFLRTNIPLEVNRILSSDEGKAFIVGSTFRIPDENIEAWKRRFVVQEKTERARNK
jgi:hypothetical protein